MRSKHKEGKFRNSKKQSIRFDSNELVLQPWFLPRQSRLAINSMIPPNYRNKMRAYFDDYGCMVCGEREVVYCSNGMCTPCYQTVGRRLKRSLKRRMTGNQDDRADLFMLRRAKLAKKLLGRFSPKWRARSLRHRPDAPLSKNPVDEALGFLPPIAVNDWEQVSNSARSDEGSSTGKSIRDLRTGRLHR
jgi:hypothetical protein